MYTTLDRVKTELKGTEAQKPAGTDQLIMNYIRTVTRRIQNFGWNFEPIYYTRKITPTPMIVNAYYNTLTLGDNLIELDSVSNNGTALVIGTDTVVYPGEGEYPIRQLRLLGCAGCLTWYPMNCSACPPLETVSVTGWWGMHQYPDGVTGGWLLSGDLVENAGGITASATTITVDDVDGEDALNRTPRFSPGNLIRVDDEMMLVLAASQGASSGTLTVRRGVNRSVAATHAENAPISIWEAEEDVISMATRQVCLLYARRGSYQQITTLPEGISVTYPSDLLSEIRNTLNQYNYV
jgi:hypothetical protein